MKAGVLGILLVLATLICASAPANAATGGGPQPGGGGGPKGGVVVLTGQYYAEVTTGKGAYSGQRPACSWKPHMPPEGSNPGLYTHLAVYDPKENISYRLFEKNCGGSVIGVYVPLLPPSRLPPYIGARIVDEGWVPKPDVVTAPPNQRTFVTLGTWFWTTTPWEPLRAWAHTFDAAGRSVWAETTITPYQMTFDPGDGSNPVTCSHQGVPWQPEYGDELATDCMVTYEHSSDVAPNGSTYEVTVTITWKGEWRGSDGSGAALDDVTTSMTFPMTVDEIQAIVVA